MKKLVQDRFARAFSRVDEIVAGAIEVCRDVIRGNREAADRLNADIAVADRELARFGALLVDPDVIAQPAAKRAMSGQMAAAQARRDELQRRLDDLRERAIDSAEAMADEVRKVFDDARRELADAATPEQDNRLVDHYLGPIEIQADGTPAQKQTPPAKTEGALQELHRGKHSMLVRKIEETRVISCWRRVLMFRSLKLPLTQRHFDWPHWGLCRR